MLISQKKVATPSIKFRRFGDCGIIVMNFCGQYEGEIGFSETPRRVQTNIDTSNR